MNNPPKERTSVARKVHMPSCAASCCCSASANCSASLAVASGLGFPLGRLRGQRRIGIRLRGYHRGGVEVVFGRGRGGGPFQAGGMPGIGLGALAVEERPDQVDRKSVV